MDLFEKCPEMGKCLVRIQIFWLARRARRGSNC